MTSTTRTNGTHAGATPRLVRAGLYVRVSTDRQAQEGVSLEVQREAAQEYARGQGWAVVESYVDDESSYAPREAYQHMIDDAVAGRLDAIVVYDFSRFGRDIAQSPADVARLERLGVKVVAVSSPHAGRLERNIYFTLADYYSYELGRKVKPSHIRRVQDGLWVSRPPVGYVLEPVGDVKVGRRVPKRLAPDPEMAPKVARLFQLFASGSYSLNALAREADSLGLKSHAGKPIARSHIATMLRNPAYIGQVAYNRRSLSKFEKKGARPPTEWVVAQGQHPPLVDADTFRKCGEVLDRHQRAYGTLTGGKPLLTGALYCGTCGGKMLGRARWKKAGHRHDGPARYYYVTYRCYHFETFRDCSNGSYHGGKRLEEWVKGQLMRLPITPEDRQAARAELRRLTSTQAGDVELRRRALQEEKEARMADLKALSWRLVRDEIPAAVYADMRRDVEAAIADIDSRLAQLRQAETLDASAEEALKVLDGVDWAMFDAQAWKEAIAALVSKVVVEGRGQYRIEWRPGIAELLRP